MKAKKFDQTFDEGADLAEAMGLAKAKQPLQEQRRVNVDVPRWMVERLDKEAGRLGVTRQSVIKFWLSKRLEKTASNTSTRNVP